MDYIILLWLNYLHIHYHKYFTVFWHNDVDLTLFPIIFITIALPLTYLRFAASNPNHTLHNYRIETKEKFLSDTRNNLPNFFKIDIILNMLMMSILQLSGILNTNTFDILSINIFITYYLNALSILVLFDAVTYWMHRLVHIKTFYKYHKQHHQYIEVIAGGVSRGSVFGKLLLVLPATLLNPCVYGMHISLFISFISWIQWHSILEHSGFDWLPFTLWNSLGWIDSEFYNQHEFHHNRNNGCFSGYSPGFWDYICQTDKKYIELKNKNKLSALPSITTTVKTYADLLTFLITIVE
eukprot:160261_1